MQLLVASGSIGTIYYNCASFGRKLHFNCWRASSWIAVREFANKSAASAASPDYVKFQAVIKSAASAASRKTKNQGPRSRGAQPSPGVRMTTRRPWAPLDLGP